jgi:hypothetical protein
MRRQVIVLGIAILCLPIARVGAQRVASTGLTVNVVPESHLSPRQIPLKFVVTPDGAGGITSQNQIVSMWVRALPGQSIHLKATLGAFSVPVRGLSPAVQWSGSPAAATSGGQRATCNSGSFEGGPPEDLVSGELVSGWTQSGTLTCNIVWSLASPESLMPGIYTGTVDLNLTSE